MAWAFPKNSSYTEIFNQVLRKMSENGIIKKLLMDQVLKFLINYFGVFFSQES